MDEESLCFICQDFEKNVGHSTKSCPENICKKCGLSGHSRLQCENQKVCLICKDFEMDGGHQTSFCPNQRCKLCKTPGHSMIQCRLQKMQPCLGTIHISRQHNFGLTHPLSQHKYSTKSHQNFSFTVKFRYYEKVTKFEKNLPLKI